LVYENWKQTSARKPLRLSDARALGLRDKYRRGVFTAQVLHDLRNIFTSVCSDFESQLMEFDGEDDHVHLLVNYPPKITVAALVNSLKGVSGRLLRLKNYPSIRRMLWDKSLWSPSSPASHRPARAL
jgi:putative transposase